MLSPGLALGLPEAEAGMKEPLQDSRGAREETWTPSSQLSFGFESHVSRQQPRVSVRTRPARVHTVLAGPCAYLANTHSYMDFMLRKQGCV